DALERQRIDNVVREERGEGLHCEVVDARQLHDLEPALAESLPGAVHFSEMGQLRNPRHLKALIAACAKLGVHFQTACPVHGVERQGDRITGVHTSEGTIKAGRILIAAGAWSDMLLDLVGRRVSIRPVRGQIALLNAVPPLFSRVLLAGSQYL